MAKVPNAVEILPNIWAAWVGRTIVTDDRQTDGRQQIALKTILMCHAEWHVPVLQLGANTAVACSHGRLLSVDRCFSRYTRHLFSQLLSQTKFISSSMQTTRNFTWLCRLAAIHMIFLHFNLVMAALWNRGPLYFCPVVTIFLYGRPM